jgi:pimeloyl-ACP methyl ester carboxylesterase
MTPRVVASLVFTALLLLPVLPATAHADADSASTTCETGNGSRTLLQLADELSAAGYDGPWDADSVTAAYMSASGSAVDCPLSAADTQRATAVLLIGGYGTSLSSALSQFAALRAAIAERSPSTLVVQYSYNGVRLAGCNASPLGYAPLDTAQDLHASADKLRDVVTALEGACRVDHLAIVGHSLGGLIAFSALNSLSVPDGSRLIMVDSPLGGVPARLVQTCVAIGYCPDGIVADQLAALYVDSPVADNSARAADLASEGIRVSAWGNSNDCFYDVALCAPIARSLIGADDARESQWLGIPSVVRKSYPITKDLAGIGASHTTILELAASELAAALVP